MSIPTRLLKSTRLKRLKRMIDNNDKSSLHNRWNMRILGIYFTNGLKRIFGKNFGQSYCDYLSCILFDFLEMSLFNLAALRLLSEFAEIYDFCACIYFDSVSNICPDLFNRYAIWLNRCQQQSAQNRICKFRRRSTVAFVKIS